MTWRRQVVHVLWKDIRKSRWFLAAYASMVLLVFLVPMPEQPLPVIEALWPFAVTLLACMITVLTNHDDSPITESAQWRSLPLTPSAVLTAKLMLILLLTIATLIAQVIQMRGNALSPAQWYRALEACAIVMMGLSLLVLVIASVSTSVTGALVLSLATLVGGSMLEFTEIVRGLVASGTPPETEANWRILEFAIGAVATIFALSRLYMRNVSRVAGLVMLGVAVIVFHVPGVFFQLWRDTAMSRLRAGQQVRISGITTSVFSDGPQMTTTLEADGFDPDVRVVLESARLEFLIGARQVLDVPYGIVHRGVTQIDGTESRKVTGLRDAILVEPDSIPGHHVSWPTGANFRRFAYPALLPLDQIRLQGEDITQTAVRLSGVVHLLRGDVISMPTKHGTRVTRHGLRLIELDSSAAKRTWTRILDLRWYSSAFPRGGLGEFSSAFSPFMALVNDRTRTAERLRMDGATSNPMASFMLGAGAMRQSLALVPETEFTTQKPDTIGDEWRNEAQLVLVTWTSVGRYRFSTKPTPLAFTPIAKP